MQKYILSLSLGNILSFLVAKFEQKGTRRKSNPGTLIDNVVGVKISTL